MQISESSCPCHQIREWNVTTSAMSCVEGDKPLFHKMIQAVCWAQCRKALGKIPVLLGLCLSDLALIGLSISA